MEISLPNFKIIVGFRWLIIQNEYWHLILQTIFKWIYQNYERKYLKRGFKHSIVCNGTKCIIYQRGFSVLIDEETPIKKKNI